jgi:hypothetical protein
MALHKSIVGARAAAAAATLALAAAGCTGGVSTAALTLPVTALPPLPKLPELPAAQGHASGPPIEAYAQVARGATTCWFGAGGSLKKTHVFYADADPPSSGGKAEIAIHERDLSGPTPRGAKVYRISFSGEADGTRIEHTNHKLGDDLVSAIQSDVHRFSRGDRGCASTGALAPRLEPPPTAVAPTKSGKPKHKPTVARAG